MFIPRRFLFALLSIVMLCSATVAIASVGDEEKNTAAMRRFYDEVMNKGNLKVIDELVDPQFVEHDVVPGIPANKAGLAQFLVMFRAAFPDLQVMVEDLVAKGDKVWAYIIMRGTHKGEFMDMKATGKTFEVKSFDLVRFVNGKAVEHWGLVDNMTMMQQLGALPMPEEAGMKK